MTPQVLIIDDSKLAQAMLADCLIGEGLEALHADNAEQGRWFAKRAQPDLILLDVVMPGISGFELCKQLKDDAATAHIPIIFLSSATDSIQKVQGLDLGAVDYIAKPFDQAELLARVRAALRTKRLVDMLAEQAQVDALTGLRNRKYLLLKIDEELASLQRIGRRVSLMLLDVDHFKRCNDTYGHPFGDRVLQAIAEVMQSSVRAIDVACRYGGEEFAVVFPDADGYEALELAEKVRINITKLVLNCKGQPVTFSASAGVATCEDHITRDALIQSADDALYRAKQAGRNRVLSARPTPALCV